jgi:hypothetical protein
MPTLDSIGKRAVLNHHREIPEQVKLIYIDRRTTRATRDWLTTTQ